MRRSLIFSTKDIREKGGLQFARTAAIEAFLDDPDAGQSARGLLGESYSSGTCTVNLEFSVGGENILLEGSVRGSAVLECSRCLARAPVDFEGRLDELFSVALGTIDAAEQVRQALVLSVPGKPLCSPACRGLCVRCGEDLNQGPCRCCRKPPPGGGAQES